MLQRKEIELEESKVKAIQLQKENDDLKKKVKRYQKWTIRGLELEMETPTRYGKNVADI